LLPRAAEDLQIYGFNRICKIYGFNAQQRICKTLPTIYEHEVYFDGGSSGGSSGDDDEMDQQSIDCNDTQYFVGSGSVTIGAVSTTIDNDINEVGFNNSDDDYDGVHDVGDYCDQCTHASAAIGAVSTTIDNDINDGGFNNFDDDGGVHDVGDYCDQCTHVSAASVTSCAEKAESKNLAADERTDFHNHCEVALFVAEGLRRKVEMLVDLMRVHMSRCDATSIIDLAPVLSPYQCRLCEWADSPAGLLVKELGDWQNAHSLINHVLIELQAWMGSLERKGDEVQADDNLRKLQVPEGVSGAELIGALELTIKQLQTQPDHAGDLPMCVWIWARCMWQGIRPEESVARREFLDHIMGHMNNYIDAGQFKYSVYMQSFVRKESNKVDVFSALVNLLQSVRTSDPIPS
jgi:hypothetical protein